MKTIPWDIPISARNTRANELVDLSYTVDGLTIVLFEEEKGRRWELNFMSVQAFRLTTEECALQILSSLPSPGGFFEVIDSPWLHKLGKGRIDFLEGSQTPVFKRGHTG